MIYKIPQKEKFKFTIIGCGGTGGFFIQALSRIVYDLNLNHEITLIDGDIVEEKNIGRQLFYPEETGQYKAQILAQRYSIAYGLNIRFINRFVEENDNNIKREIFKSDFIISAVDTAKARKTLHNILLSFQNYFHTERGLNVWIDSGNGNHQGQILIGNSFEINSIKKQSGKEISLLPYPSIAEPELIDEKKDKEELLSCAQAILEKEQSTTINQVMACFLASTIYYLLIGKGITYHKIIIDESIPIVSSIGVKALKCFQESSTNLQEILQPA